MVKRAKPVTSEGGATTVERPRPGKSRVRPCRAMTDEEELDALERLLEREPPSGEYVSTTGDTRELFRKHFGW